MRLPSEARHRIAREGAFPVKILDCPLQGDLSVSLYQHLLPAGEECSVLTGMPTLMIIGSPFSSMCLIELFYNFNCILIAYTFKLLRSTALKTLICWKGGIFLLK